MLITWFGELNQTSELHLPDNQCDELVECTADVLDGNILQALFLSTQQNNLDICVKYTIR
jgi:hypothetical protein